MLLLGSLCKKNFDQSGRYSLYGPFLICGSFLLLTRTILVYFTVIVIRNYGKGLKDLTTTTDQTEVVIIEEDSDEDYFETQDSNASIQY